MNKRKIISAIVDTFHVSDLEGTLQHVLERVQELIEMHGPDARLDYNQHFYYAYDNEPSPRFEIYIKYEENDAELKQRLMAEAEQTRQRNEHERKEFERLSKKFGTPE